MTKKEKKLHPGTIPPKLEPGSKFVICYSGGRSSAECALSAAKLYGPENVILLNHNITGRVERADTKRFKEDVADYLGLEITYANHPNWNEKTPIQIIKDIGYFSNKKTGTVLCTYELKTLPFYRWLEANDPECKNIYVYGLDEDEPTRINGRSQKLGSMGYKTTFPKTWPESLRVTLEMTGIKPPESYDRFKHSNCTGCLKAGFQHWYIVYVEDRPMFDEVADFELDLGYSLRRLNGQPVFLDDKRELFDEMIAAGVEPTEHVSQQKFWPDAKKKIKQNKEALEGVQETDKGVCLDCSI